MKKTTFKRIAASIAALCICSMAVAPVVADAASITINSASESNESVAGKTFNAYKILPLKKAESGYFVDTTTLDATIRDYFIAKINDPAVTANSDDLGNEIAKYLKDLNAEETKNMARDLLAKAKEAELTPVEKVVDANATSVVFDDDAIDNGYILIEDATEAVNNVNRAVSSVMLVSNVDGVYDKGEEFVDAGDVPNGEWDKGETFTDGIVINLKADKPTVIKKIVETQGNGVYDAEAGETFTDSAGNGDAVLDDGEGYVDENNNGKFDEGDTIVSVENNTYDLGETFVDSNLVDTNTACVGEKVKYQLNSVVPDTTYYDNYTFKLTDTFDAGLDVVYDESAKTGVKITLVGTNGKELVNGENYTVVLSDSTNDGHYENMYIYFIDMKGLGKDYAGYDIVVEYEAVVNEDAIIGSIGNVNKIDLEYSNNPNQSPDNDLNDDGIPDDEDDDTTNDEVPDNPTTKTPEDKVITYLTQVKIAKVDEDLNALGSVDDKGATFSISGSGVSYIVKTGVTADGEKKVTVSTDDITVDATAGTTAMVDENGYLVFSGLGAGIYTISEVNPPEGYNRAEDKIVEITCDLKPVVSEGNEECVWKYNGETSTGIYTMQIINRIGALFPSTGGIGTTIFTVVGVTLMAGAAGAFAIKRKAMNK